MKYIVYIDQEDESPFWWYNLEEAPVNEIAKAYHSKSAAFLLPGRGKVDFTKLNNIAIYENSSNANEKEIEERMIATSDHYHKGMKVKKYRDLSQFGIDVSNHFLQTDLVASIDNKQDYINEERIKELLKIDKSKFDLTKLIQLCDELNSSHLEENWFAVGALVRAIIDHVPPIFGYNKFTEVANNYNSPGAVKSFKDSMQHLENSMRKITDRFLHSTITKSESLPNETQVDCKRDLDVLLGEIVRILKT